MLVLICSSSHVVCLSCFRYIGVGVKATSVYTRGDCFKRGFGRLLEGPAGVQKNNQVVGRENELQH